MAVVWGSTSEENLSKIEILLQNCISIIYFSDFRNHTNQLFITHVLKFREIIKLNHLQLLSNFWNDSLPTDLKSLFKLNEIVRGHQTRQLFHVPSVDTSTYGINSIKYHGPVLRNTILKNTIMTDKDYKTNVSFSQIYNTNQFKQVLKRHFFYNYVLE